MKIWVPFSDESKEVKPSKVTILSKLMFDKGKMVREQVDLGERRRFCMKEF